MTGDKKWFSSLTPVKEKMYITFGDNGRGRVISEGVVHVSDKVTSHLNSFPFSNKDVRGFTILENPSMNYR
jgi:hypothetical protein